MRGNSCHGQLFPLLLCAWLMLQSNVAWTAPALDAAPQHPTPVSLSPHIEVMEDAAGTLSLADVTRPEAAARFQPAQPGAAINFGLTRSAWWFRFTLTNTGDAPVERLMEIGWANLGRIDFHAPGESAIHTGSLPPHASRPYPNRYFVFPVSVPAKSSRTYHFRIQSAAAIIVPARLWTPAAFHAHERRDYIGQSWYFGIASAMIIFNLLLFVALGDTIYLLYVAFVALSALTLGTENGLTKEFLWPDAPAAWADISSGVCYTVGLGILILFMRRMLDTAGTLPRFDRFLRFMAGLHFAVPFALPLAYADLIEPTTVLYFFSVLLVFGTAAYCAWRRQRSAILFLAAYVTLFLGGIVVALRNLGFLPTNAFTVNAIQVGSALEMLLLAFALADRFNMLRREKARAQREALDTKQMLVETLRSSERQLEERVARRTEELTTTLDDLKRTQAQLVHSEKMASLGQLVANIAHEINTPISAVKSSGRSIEDALRQLVAELPILLHELDADSERRFLDLVAVAISARTPATSRQQRSELKRLEEALSRRGIDDARLHAGQLIQFGLTATDTATLDSALHLLAHPRRERMFELAASLATIAGGTANIAQAVDRVSKIVFALKSFSHAGPSKATRLHSLREGIDTVLTLYQNQMRHGTRVVVDMEDVPPIACHPEELNQVWTHLIHNALQAMTEPGGTLTIRLRRADNAVRIEIGDTGCGIADEIRDRIFEPFFTTRTVGEGSGLGLDIVRRVVEHHNGRVEVDSTPGAGSTFTVILPC